MSAWFKSLDDERESILLMILEQAVDGAMFGLLSVLGRSVAIENGPDKGRLRLYYEDNSDFIYELTGGTLLHELY